MKKGLCFEYRVYCFFCVELTAADIAQDVFTDQYVMESCFIICEVTLDDGLG